MFVGRSDYSQWVTQYQLAISTDGDTWVNLVNSDDQTLYFQVRLIMFIRMSRSDLHINDSYSL